MYMMVASFVAHIYSRPSARVVSSHATSHQKDIETVVVDNFPPIHCTPCYIPPPPNAFHQPTGL